MDPLLALQPNAIVRYRYLRDISGVSPDSHELASAKQQMLRHPWVEELTCHQHPDGSWGRFHSMDSTLRSRFPTSETAIRRAFAIGLEQDDPPLAKAVDFMVRVLDGEARWSDRVEKSEGWPLGVEAITAGTLAQVAPTHPAIRPAWEYWVEVARRSFISGNYNPNDEWKAHRELRGTGIRYLGSRYALTLLGARSADLPATLEHQIVNWIWNNPEGIGYLGADLKHPRPFHIFNWLGLWCINR